MGFSHSTYFFYGVHVPRERYVTDSQHRETELLGAAIKSLNDPTKALGYITAGDYDQDELFLVTVPDGRDCEVDLGTFTVTHPHTDAGLIPEWDRLLANLIGVVGYEGLAEPGWIVVPDLS